MKTKYKLNGLKKWISNFGMNIVPSWRGATYYLPGHFYSPLLDLSGLKPEETHLPFDGPEYWECVELRLREQREYFEDLIDHYPAPDFPQKRTEGRRYFSDNGFFGFADAFTLSGIIQKERPRSIVEVGSGFSSSVMLDTLEHIGETAKLTFIDPFPERLQSLLSPQDKLMTEILARPVQEVSLDVFDQLEARDVLFIDSSHVAKIGSDVTHLMFRVLPRLKPGVIVHVHDIFYPYSYPIGWIREGRAWNESLFLRAFLVGNQEFEILAFNSFAGQAFPEIFKDKLPKFLKNTGGSIWLRKRKL